MLIGEVCEHCGIGKDTVRHYEAKGLLKSQQRPAGSRFYRDYAPDTVRRIELIKLAKQHGFTLAEIKSWLDLTLSGKLSKTAEIEIARAKIAEVDARIKELRLLKKLLTSELNKLL